jgi:hypothetical protein
MLFPCSEACAAVRVVLCLSRGGACQLCNACVCQAGRCIAVGVQEVVCKLMPMS